MMKQIMTLSIFIFFGLSLGETKENKNRYTYAEELNYTDFPQLDISSGNKLQIKQYFQTKKMIDGEDLPFSVNFLCEGKTDTRKIKYSCYILELSLLEQHIPYKDYPQIDLLNQSKVKIIKYLKAKKVYSDSLAPFTIKFSCKGKKSLRGIKHTCKIQGLSIFRTDQDTTE